jgi:peptidyl-prolyl cis-trans isomerase SurA
MSNHRLLARRTGSLVPVLALTFALAFAALPALAQTPTRDPSGMGPVGLEPMRPITATINGNPAYPGTVPAAATALGSTSGTTASGPSLPANPSSMPPVSIDDLPPIHSSINSGHASPSWFSRMFRNRRETPAKPFEGRTTPTRLLPPSDLMPKYDTSTVPAAARPPVYAQPAAVAPTQPGRPSPYAGQMPAAARPQAGSAPASDEPPLGRPVRLDDRTPAPRPQASPTPGLPVPHRPQAETPMPMPTLPPVPTELPGLPPLPDPSTPPSTNAPGAAAAAALAEPEPGQPAESAPSGLALAPAQAGAPPPGTDPLQGMDLPKPVPPPDLPLPSPEMMADLAVRRTSTESTALKVRSQVLVAKLAASVGDEIITFDELDDAVRSHIQAAGQPLPEPGPEYNQILNMVASRLLNDMIDQALVLQEANRRMKGAKTRQAILEMIEKQWREDELPGLLRKTGTPNEYELKKKLTEDGKSYEKMKEAYRKKTMATQFLHNELRHKITSDLIEQKLYFNAHLDQFQHPAAITWREIELLVDRFPNRAAARKKADEILARLLRNEDFAAVAKLESHGPGASSGGLWANMSPGSYGIPSVNDELNRLPVGQVSQVIEAPNSFHIIRVESRRAAGNDEFREVEEKVKMKVIEQNYIKAYEAYLAKLREKTIVRTMFDRSASDPSAYRQAANLESKGQTAGK